MKLLSFTAKFISVVFITFGWLSHSTADDTEIYQAQASASDSGRPKVLIIFDDSGSMRRDVTVQPPAYDANDTYTGTWDNSRIYFVESGSDPSTNLYFSASVNRCSESFTPLAEEGFYIGDFQRQTSTVTDFDNPWRDLSDDDNTRNTANVECRADSTEGNTDNGSGQPTGYACETSNTSIWCTEPDGDLVWDDQIIYTGHYLNYLDQEGTTTRSRLAIAQDTVESIINANPNIDFGLMTFNANDDGQDEDGGRIINRIITNSTETDRDSIITNVFDLNADSWTPLCESAYEAYRYLSGSSVLYGTQREDSTNDSILRDTNAESGGSYISPVSDCAYIYVILMTDGLPSNDTAANAAIRELTGETCKSYTSDTSGVDTEENCLPQLAEYMANTDLDGDSTNGDNFARFYTIGFEVETAQEFLEDTAQAGQGEYYNAQGATGLAAAFQSALTDIATGTESFTSPAVAVDTFSRTESRNEVFFAMFEPSDRVNWQGNIKRLNLVIESGEAVLKDANNEDAFTPLGTISENAQTVWSTTEDGNRVNEGGVGALLAARDPATRNLYTNTGTGGALQAFNADNLTNAGLVEFTIEELLRLFLSDDSTEMKETILWAQGYDIDGESGEDVTAPRPWILGDMLHSRPIVINYGALGDAHTQANPEQRLLVGTNAGFFHMFDVEDGSETWAFSPKELSEIHQLRRQNEASTDHVYGLDAPPSIYTDDGGDGTIDASAGDKAYVYFGMRRGGNNIYALDVSDPDSPSYLFQINGGSGVFSEMGQSWSVPIVTKIPGYKYDHDNDSQTPEVPKPVLIFGAGYDTAMDSKGKASEALTDETDAVDSGRGVYVVDAFTGDLVHSITPGLASNSNTNIAIQYPVPGNVTPVDSNSDELTDRLYFTDTGGHIWRVDINLPNSEEPETLDETDLQWRVLLFADVNGGTEATDRRFFSAPDVVRTRQKICTEYYPSPNDDVCRVLTSVNFDAVLIGTGDRTNPNGTDVSNQFYMFRDEGVATYTADLATTDCSDEDNYLDFRCNLPLAPSDLYDATANLIQSSDSTTASTAKAGLENSQGWMLSLGDKGEKSLSRSLTLFGSLFFTTFSPNTSNEISCQVRSGQGRLYQIDIITAGAKRDFVNNDGVLDRSTDLGTLIPDTPSPHFGSDKKIRLLFPSGGGEFSGSPLDSGAQLPQPYGIYWYREEL